MILATIWYQRHPLRFMLVPLAVIFRLIITLRRFLYRSGIKKIYQLPIPVIVVGNLTVGGNGKTPMTIWLVELLKKNGYCPGVVSRGYGGAFHGAFFTVTPSTSPRMVGDEPVLIARKTNVPVIVGKQRARCAMQLIEQFNCNVIVSDDGLQHYALGRYLELVVVDGLRRFGNGYCLPAGPLREPISRLQSVDAVIIAQGQALPHEFAMQMQVLQAYQLNNPQQVLPLAAFKGKKIHAIAGVGNPARFFISLKEHGLIIEEHAYPDHYIFSKEDFKYKEDEILMITEKDAVKCENYILPNCWVVMVEAILPPNLAQNILTKLKNFVVCH